jgi:CDGSH-type Zn-finger protein
MENPIIASAHPVVLELEAGTYWWCSCGRSTKQPWCDGSHKGTEFRPTRVDIEETRNVAMCACKQTGSEPFCDGSHKHLPST